MLIYGIIIIMVNPNEGRNMAKKKNHLSESDVYFVGRPDRKGNIFVALNNGRTFWVQEEEAPIWMLPSIYRSKKGEAEFSLI